MDRQILKNTNNNVLLNFEEINAHIMMLLQLKMLLAQRTLKLYQKPCKLARRLTIKLNNFRNTFLNGRINV